MFFKPRIFISSLITNKIELREKIKKILEESGGEILLYEDILTPAVNKMAYRHDIIEADFVIFILDDGIGTPTETGLTGIEEELLISERRNKPTHIYLKTSAKNALIEEIKEKGYSYHLYQDDEQLIEKIRSTIFIIAKEIALFQINEKDFSQNRLKKLSINKDYNLALEFIQRNNLFEYQFGRDDNGMKAVAFMYLFEGMLEWFNDHQQDVFIDSKLSALYGACLLINEEFAQRRMLEFELVLNVWREIKVDNDFSVTVYRDKPHSNHQQVDQDWYRNKYVEYARKYTEFKDYLMIRKLWADSLM